MNSYLERNFPQQKTSKSLNPMTKKYEPLSGNSLRLRVDSIPMQNEPSILGARPKETSKLLTIKSSQEAHVITGYQQGLDVYEMEQPALNVPYVQTSLNSRQPMQAQPREESYGGIYHIMQKQNEITASLVQQQR